MKKKTTARERRAEERKILVQMNEAMSEKQEKTPSEQSKKQQKKQQTRKYDDTMPEKVHCKRCKTLMENGVCPVCGYRIYVPMAKEKRDKIRTIVAAVCMVAFIVLFVLLQAKKG